MAYAVKADLLNRMPLEELIELTDDAGTGSEDDAKITAALAAASAEIDSYARGTHGLPLGASEKVKSLTLDLAIFELEKRKRAVRDNTQAAYDAAVRFLRDVSAGKVSLSDGTTTQVATGAPKTPDRDAQADKRQFEDGNLDGY